MDKVNSETGEEYPDLDHIVRMQENAKRLLKMTVGAATRENAPHSDLVKEELTNMLQDDNQNQVDTSDL